MTVNILSKNLSLLKSLHPKAYEIIVSTQSSLEYEVSLSQSGYPTLSHQSSKGKKKYLLSKYDPMREATRLIESLDTSDTTNFIVVGIGLGYQVAELIKSTSEHSRIVVIENDRHLARLAFETNDLKQLLTHPGLSLVFSDQREDAIALLEEEKVNFSLNGYRLIQQNALSEVHSKRTNELLAGIKELFQESTIELKTQSAKSKTFYNNIYRNYSNLISSTGITNLKDSLLNIPAVICSAGPSLDKNIQFLKAKRDNFLLITVATALKPLIKNGISPDFIVVIDPDETTLNFFDLQNNSKDAWLLYNPVVPSKIPDTFTGKRLTYDSSINLALWLQKYIGKKGSLGKIFSVAHAAFQFARFIGCGPIIFIGQDLSFSKKRLHSRHSYYYRQQEDRVNHLETMKYLDQEKFHLYSSNLLERTDIFDKKVTTSISMDTYSNMLANSIDENSRSFNATEGGIGISGVENISLREAINLYCTVNISVKISDALNSIPLESSDTSQITRAADKQLAFFTKLSSFLNRIEKQFLKDKPLTNQSKGEFVQNMKLTIQYLLKDEDATLLLQGYDYSGFSRWNQRSTAILNRKKLVGENELLEEEFLRDQEFFKVLKGSVNFNMDVFESFSKEI
ncbi:MAG: hypothetical protein ACI8PD_001299 [Nitrospinales bacterium]|jgi:hypothetical protein